MDFSTLLQADEVWYAVVLPKRITASTFIDGLVFNGVPVRSLGTKKVRTGLFGTSTTPALIIAVTKTKVDQLQRVCRLFGVTLLGEAPPR